MHVFFGGGVKDLNRDFLTKRPNLIPFLYKHWYEKVKKKVKKLGRFLV